jgi:hypothetical protein
MEKIRIRDPQTALHTTPVDPQSDLVESLGLGPVSLGSWRRRQPGLVEKSGLRGRRRVAADLLRGNKSNEEFSCVNRKRRTEVAADLSRGNKSNEEFSCVNRKRRTEVAADLSQRGNKSKRGILTGSSVTRQQIKRGILTGSSVTRQQTKRGILTATSFE